MSIYERLKFLALGGKHEYLHNKGKENKRTTRLQNFLSTISKEARVRS